MSKERPDLKSPELAPYWLAALIESADDAIITKTLEGVITSWNKGAQRIFGYTAEEVIGKSVTILIPEGYLDEEPAILARLRSGDRIEHYETVRIRKDGRLINISLTVSPIIGPKGTIVGASKIARDITDQVQARRALDEASERLKLALIASRLGDWSWDAKTDVVTMSEIAARIFDIPPGSTITWAQMRNLLHEEDRQRAKEAVENSLADHSDYDIDYRVIRADGSEVWVSVKGRGIYGVGGTVVGMLGFVQDISNRKAAEAETERLYRQAEESSRLKEEFLATISHELRTPLSAILGWARMLRLGQLSNENTAKALDTIERNARAQAQLIDDLLDVSRIVTGKLRMDVR
ncbi:MAG TPA: PAS domain S-box protein, partial [Pyrinomonadaceae bacterium]|nr:PAS domain S-box protein [Pyrinomonadaceae bacterium]